MIDGKKQYTISYLARTEADKESVLKSLKEVNALTLTEGRVSELKLAYPIKKQTSAFFGFIAFEVAPEAISKIDEQLKFEEGILRFLIVIAPARKLNARLVNNQKNKEEIEKPDAVNNADLIREEEASLLKEVEEMIAEQTDNLSLAQNINNDNSLIEEISASEDKIDNLAFDEKLEEILADSQIK